MNKLLLSTLALLIVNFIALPTLAKAYELPIRYVYDGDTILLKEPALPAPLSNVSIRLRGIDTPELRGKCEAEVLKAYAAKQHLKSLIGMSKTVTLTNYKWDKYGGRIDADLIVNGINLSDAMINSGYAVAYLGFGVKTDWCKAP